MTIKNIENLPAIMIDTGTDIFLFFNKSSVKSFLRCHQF